MLDPYDRLQLVSELRPPEGYVFAGGIGTTFSLDLDSLLTVPLSLVLGEFESREDAFAQPEAVLEGLRRIAGKLLVFCHRGRIKRPSDQRVLFSFLEDMVVEALPAGRAGAFHPKVWVLRFQREDDLLLRVLVLSRNLTFDQSWDTVLVLEGAVMRERAHEVRDSARLARFVRSLGTLAINASPDLGAAIDALADDVSRTVFDVPEGFKSVAFRPLGIGGTAPQVSDRQHSRIMIVSPFLTDLSASGTRGVLDELLYRKGTRRNVLVSRADQLDALSLQSRERLSETTDLYVLDDATAAAGGDSVAAADAATEPDLAGLHAKLYVVEHGTAVTLLTGSANATAAAWGRGAAADDGPRGGVHGESAATPHRVRVASANVEFMVALAGERKQVGIDALLGDAAADVGAGGLRKVLKPYRAPLTPLDSDEEREALEAALEDARDAIVAAPLRAQIASAGAEVFRMVLVTPPLVLPPGIGCTVCPVTLPPSRALRLAPDSVATHVGFDGLSALALSPFWAFRLEGRLHQRPLGTAFVLKLPVEGMPEGRLRAVVSHLIDTPDRFLRYLAVLLADDPLQGSAPTGGIRESQPTGARAQAAEELVLLENLVRAFSRDPDKLDRVERLVSDLSGGPGAASTLPEGFAELWRAFRAARP